jgi:hypothetical protein
MERSGFSAAVCIRCSRRKAAKAQRCAEERQAEVEGRFSASLRLGVKVGGLPNRRSKQFGRLASSFPQCPLAPFPIATFPVARGVAHCLTVGISRG